MEHSSLSVTYAEISVMLGLALVILWLQLCGRSLRAVLSPTALSLSGHFRSRPDEALECALRAAFTQLDEELALVLSDPPTVLPRH